MSERLSLIESLMDRFPGVPREAVLKEDLLRTGIAFDASARPRRAGRRRRSR